MFAHLDQMEEIMAVVIHLKAPGGIDQFGPVDVDIGEPGPGEIRLEQHAVGVNFIDIYHRRGEYPLPLPAILGVEAVGRVTTLGRNVDDLAVGDRVVYGGAIGAYASERLLPAWRAIKLPASISDEAAA